MIRRVGLVLALSVLPNWYGGGQEGLVDSGIRIVTSAGEPVVGVDLHYESELYLLARLGYGGELPKKQAGDAVTDESGRFRVWREALAAGIASVELSKRGWCELEPCAGPRPLGPGSELVMTPVEPFRTCVRDPDGNPVAGATIIAKFQVLGRCGSARADSNAKGLATLDVPSSMTALTVTRPPGRPDLVQELAWEGLPSRGETLTLVLEREHPPGGTLTVRAVDAESGEDTELSAFEIRWLPPAAAEYVEASKVEASLSGSVVRCPLLAPGKYQVFLRSRGFAPWRAEVPVERTSEWLELEARLLRPGSVAIRVEAPTDFRATQGVIRLRHANGLGSSSLSSWWLEDPLNPLARGNDTDERIPVGEVTKRESWRFDRLQPGTWNLMVVAFDEEAWVVDPFWFEVPAGQHVEITARILKGARLEIEVPGGFLGRLECSLEVVDEKGRVVENPFFLFDESGTPLDTSCVLPPGRYRVVARWTGPEASSETTTSDEVELISGRTQRVRVRAAE